MSSIILSIGNVLLLVCGAIISKCLPVSYNSILFSRFLFWCCLLFCCSEQRNLLWAEADLEFGTLLPLSPTTGTTGAQCHPTLPWFFMIVSGSLLILYFFGDTCMVCALLYLSLAICYSACYLSGCLVILLCDIIFSQGYQLSWWETDGEGGGNRSSGPIADELEVNSEDPHLYYRTSYWDLSLTLSRSMYLFRWCNK